MCVKLDIARAALGAARHKDYELANWARKYGMPLLQEVTRHRAEKPWVKADQVNEPEYWFWFSDPESIIVPVMVMWSPTTQRYFACQDQHGWNHSQDVVDMGGLWKKLDLPEVTQEMLDTFSA